MKRPLISLLLIFAPQEVGAAPLPPCPGQAELLILRPLAAFVDGGEALRGSNGRFRTDAGFEFDVESGQVLAGDGDSAEGCMQPSTKLTAEMIDPFTGASHVLSMEATP